MDYRQVAFPFEELPERICKELQIFPRKLLVGRQLGLR
jgi:hypothetical protein